LEAKFQLSLLIFPERIFSQKKIVYFPSVAVDELYSRTEEDKTGQPVISALASTDTTNSCAL
jgi:hypothetical protein